MAEEKDSAKPEGEAETEEIVAETDGGDTEDAVEELDELTQAIKDHEEWLIEKIREATKAGSSSPETKEAVEAMQAELASLRENLAAVHETLKTMSKAAEPKAPLQETEKQAKERNDAEKTKPKNPVNWI